MAVEALGSLQVPLVLCYRLGRALRYHNEESFFHTYDSIKPIDGADGSIFQSQLITIKEAARQISDLSIKDYLILAKSTGPLQICNTHDEVTNQLEKLIKKARLALEDEGSDSGAVSDYFENSGLSAVDADSGKFNDLDFPFDDTHLLNKENWKESKSNMDEDFLKDTFHGIDSSSSSISQTNTSDPDSSDGVEDPLCLLEINQDSYDSFCQKSLWHSLMDIDSDSKLARNEKKNITDKPIKVAELEKSFFTMNSDEFVKPCRSLIDMSNKNDSHTKPHWKSLLHSRSGDEYEIWVQCKHDYVVTMDSDQKPKLSVPTNCSVSKTTKIETETDRMDTNLTSKEGVAVSTGRKYSNNIADKLQSCSSSHHQQEVKQIEKDQQIQSPLALHSQNMWSSFFKAQTKTLKNQQWKNKHKNFHSHEMQDSEFNHFEVGQYLLRGWEEAEKELMIY